jgi:hypothetical protein
MFANRGGLSNCSRVELNYGAGDFAVPAFASWGMIIEESRVACCWLPTRPSSRRRLPGHRQHRVSESAGRGAVDFSATMQPRPKGLVEVGVAD